MLLTLNHNRYRDHVYAVRNIYTVLFVMMLVVGTGCQGSATEDAASTSDTEAPAAISDTQEAIDKDVEPAVNSDETGSEAVGDQSSEKINQKPMEKGDAAAAQDSKEAPDATDSDSRFGNYFEITTPLGRLVVRLYDETPLHRDNFRKLVSEKFYDGTTFHRVMAQFMIQGGDPNSKDDDPRNDGLGGPGYQIPAEFNPTLIHKKGALAAARQPDQVNPERKSSGSQFYIVQGRVYPPEVLDQMEGQLKQKWGPDFHFSDAAREAYTTVGGTPFLDMDYTVFGELVEGFDVLDAIAATETPRKLQQPSQTPDRPPSDIPMTIRALEHYTSTN